MCFLPWGQTRKTEGTARVEESVERDSSVDTLIFKKILKCFIHSPGVFLDESISGTRRSAAAGALPRAPSAGRRLR